MSEALERVIADQQLKIARLTEMVDRNHITLEYNYKELVELKDAAFSVMNAPNNYAYRQTLRETLTKQGWCLSCEQMPCECDE